MLLRMNAQGELLSLMWKTGRNKRLEWLYQSLSGWQSSWQSDWLRTFVVISVSFWLFWRYDNMAKRHCKPTRNGESCESCWLFGFVDSGLKCYEEYRPRSTAALAVASRPLRDQSAHTPHSRNPLDVIDSGDSLFSFTHQNSLSFAIPQQTPLHPHPTDYPTQTSTHHFTSTTPILPHPSKTTTPKQQWASTPQPQTAPWARSAQS